MKDITDQRKVHMVNEEKHTLADEVAAAEAELKAAQERLEAAKSKLETSNDDSITVEPTADAIVVEEVAKPDSPSQDSAAAETAQAQPQEQTQADNQAQSTTAQNDYYWQQPVPPYEQPHQQQHSQQPYGYQQNQQPPQNPYQAPQQQAYYQQQQPYAQQVVSTKDHVAAGLLGIFLGSLGIHKFYLGYNTSGFIMLAVTILGSVFTFGIAGGVMWVIGVIEGIMYLTKSQTDFEQMYVFNKREWF